MNGKSDVEEMKQKLKRSTGPSRGRLDERLDAGLSSGDVEKDPGEDTTAHRATFHQEENEGPRPPGPHHDVDEEEIETYAPKEKHKEAPKRRKRTRPKFTRAHFYLMLLMLLLFLVGLLIWYVTSSASEVKNIEISGNQLISDEEVEERLQFGTGDRMFSANLSQATENIAMLPAVEEVEIEREWWNTINVSVTEYQAVGYVANNSDYYPVLENAQVLRGYPSTPGSAPILHYFEGREFDRMVEGLNDIEPDIREGISEIYYRPSENSSTRIHMFMNDGQEIVADYRTINEKMNYYLSMREEIGDPQSGLIDLEIGSSFLPYGSDEALEVKAGIYEAPVQAPYIEEVNGALVDVKESLSNIGEAEDGEE
ncbi:cell division protein FtsQ/DivIB [Salinicoccus roseus]|uniref:cell division protein FtsQ/DivIB n=1 Tax=Salinicoccus roseus TaxID=45670 RepID=UPI0035684B8F